MALFGAALFPTTHRNGEPKNSNELGQETKATEEAEKEKEKETVCVCV